VVPSRGSANRRMGGQAPLPYLMVFTPSNGSRNLRRVPRSVREERLRASRYQLTVNVPIVVAENDARRAAEKRNHVGVQRGPADASPFWRRRAT
jgi:hypothetical protein